MTTEVEPNWMTPIKQFLGIGDCRTDTTQLAKQMIKDTRDTTPSSFRRTSVKEELNIGQSIRCSFF